MRWVLKHSWESSACTSAIADISQTREMRRIEAVYFKSNIFYMVFCDECKRSGCAGVCVEKVVDAGLVRAAAAIQEEEELDSCSGERPAEEELEADGLPPLPKPAPGCTVPVLPGCYSQEQLDAMGSDVERRMRVVLALSQHKARDYTEETAAVQATWPPPPAVRYWMDGGSAHTAEGVLRDAEGTAAAEWLVQLLSHAHYPLLFLSQPPSPSFIKQIARALLTQSNFTTNLNSFGVYTTDGNHTHLGTVWTEYGVSCI
jgi:hypothetical protein